MLNKDKSYNYLTRIYVITLKSKEEYIKSESYNSIKDLGCKIILSKGVILNKEQSEKYKYYAKSSIGSTLAHQKVWKKINKVNEVNREGPTGPEVPKGAEGPEGPKFLYNDFSIVLEDDAILTTNADKFKEELKEIIHKNNDFYRLHSDGMFISLASYIIKHNTVNNLYNKYKILVGHVDFDVYFCNLFGILGNYKLVTHNYNLFRTDESESSNRIDKYNCLNILKGLKLTSRSNKDLKIILSFKTFRIFEYEFIVFELLLITLLIISIIFKNFYLFLIVIILFII